MGDNDFTVHLVSNVSPDIYPQNNPSKFSTQLANEINLGQGEWEVGVRQIMYPTHIATTSKEEKINIYKYEDYYRNLLPHPARSSLDSYSTGVTFDFSQVAYASDKVKFILDTVNNTKWCNVQNIIKLEYKKSSGKFIIHLYYTDIVAILSPSLAKYLGVKDTCFVRGSHWAWSPFQKDKNVDNDSLKMYLCDLQALQKETFLLQKSVDVNGNLLYSGTIVNQFRDTLPDEWFPEPKYSITLDPYKGTIAKKVVTPVPEKFKTHHKDVLCFAFDKVTTKSFNLKYIYAPFNRHQSFAFSPVSKNEGDKKHPLDDIHAVSVTVYYATARQITLELQKSPIASIPVTSKQVKDPIDLLPALNQQSKSYNYLFKFNQYVKRFELHNGSTHVIEMSKSLASILGFESVAEKRFHPNVRVRAPEFPIFDREITALYVYTNIIESVYIGNVRAPLLLTCPFKTKQRKEVVTQQEFLNPCYTPINRANIQQIDIGIYDDAGALIPFLYGKTKITLHFRRRQ